MIGGYPTAPLQPQPNSTLCPQSSPRPRGPRNPSLFPAGPTEQEMKSPREVMGLRHIDLYLFSVRKVQELHQKILQPLLPTDKNTPQNYKALSVLARGNLLFGFK